MLSMVFQIPLALWNTLVPILEYLAVTTMVFPRSNAVIFLPALAAAAPALNLSYTGFTW